MEGNRGIRALLICIILGMTSGSVNASFRVFNKKNENQLEIATEKVRYYSLLLNIFIVFSFVKIFFMNNILSLLESD